MTTRFLIAGLGAVAQTHVDVLAGLPDADVVAGVDIDTSRTLKFRGQDRPVYKTVDEASRHHAPAVVVIATPTATHADAYDEITESLPDARILVEKPAADNLADARRLITPAGKRRPAEVAYHMSFSPEVTWGRDVVRARAAEIGGLVSAEIFFADPYYDQFEQAQAALGNSWIDSGINALSILSRFADLKERGFLRQLSEDRESVFEARIACDAGDHAIDSLLVTSWHVTDAAKTTRLRYESGAELLMDHTAVSAYLVMNGQLRDWTGSDRGIPRRERHYRALYQEWLTEGSPAFSIEESLHLHELLLAR